jgi:CheY-like chemotaxis protein
MQAKRILICDDDPGILDMLELILDETGHQIIPEANSLNVRALMEREKPDLVVLDLWMPMLSGDQVLRVIRENPVTREIPVIVISASTDGKEIAKRAGASDYLAKPFDVDQLLSMVGGYLGS